MSRQELEIAIINILKVLKENMNTVSKEIGRSVIVLLLYISNFIYFWLYWVFVTVHGLSLAVASRSYSLVAVHRLLIVGFSCCREWALEPGFSSCGTQD